MMQNAFITGAGGNVADVLIARFLEQNWRLALAARTADAAERLKQRYPSALAIPGDLADPAAASRTAQEVLATMGVPDALLHLVGSFGMTPAVEAGREEIERQLTANLLPVVNVTQALLPAMIERGHGFILGVAAKAALTGDARLGPYAAAKAALAAYLKSIGAEVENRGVVVAVLYPMGTIDTRENREAMPQADPENWIDPGELCDAVSFLALRRGRARIRELHLHPRGRH